MSHQRHFSPIMNTRQASPNMCQNSSLNGSRNPHNGNPRYRSPGYESPGYESPVYGNPGYQSPRYGSPGYGSPVYGSPVYGNPGYGSPGYENQQYGSPRVGSPGCIPLPCSPKSNRCYSPYMKPSRGQSWHENKMPNRQRHHKSGSTQSTQSYFKPSMLEDPWGAFTSSNTKSVPVLKSSDVLVGELNYFNASQHSPSKLQQESHKDAEN